MRQAEPTWAAVPARPHIPSPLFLLGGGHEAAEVGRQFLPRRESMAMTEP